VYIPEYLISAKILQNISAIEYSKAIIDTTTLLENLELQLSKKAKIEKITALLKLEGYLFPEEFIKKRIENLLDKSHVEIENVIKARKNEHEPARTQNGLQAPWVRLVLPGIQAAKQHALGPRGGSSCR
jgi:hypothetical protein